MGRTRDAILDALENLTADEFKKFKLKLLSVPLREGYGRIPRGTLMSMDAIDLTDKLVSSYLEEYSAELTGIVLREMGMQETAEHLQLRCTGERAPTHTLQGPPPVPLTAPAPPALAPGSFHFLFLLPSKITKASPAGKGGFLCLALHLASRPRDPNPRETKALGRPEGDRWANFLTGPAPGPAGIQAHQTGTSPGEASTPKRSATPHHTPSRPFSLKQSAPRPGTRGARSGPPFRPTTLLGPHRWAAGAGQGG